MTILDQLAEHAVKRVAEAKAVKPLEEVKREALALPKGDFAFENARRHPRRKALSRRIFRILRLPASTRQPVRTASLFLLNPSGFLEVIHILRRLLLR